VIIFVVDSFFFNKQFKTFSMRKVLLLTCVLALTFSSNSLFAQNGDYKSNIYAGAGFSLAGALFDALGAGGTGEVTTNSLPAIQLNYDYALTPRVSAGLAFSYQGFGFDVNDYQYLDQDFNLVTEDFSADLQRTNIALRVLFHYGNSEKLDMYSGVRVGMTNWVSKINSSDPNNDFFGADLSGWSFAPQLIGFGMRYYVTDNIGLSLETALGAPHFLSIGANYRL
jgi:opacity protein-like surface antigen